MSRMKFGVSTLGYIQVLDIDHRNGVDDLVRENHLQHHHYHLRTLLAIEYLVSLDSTSRLSKHELGDTKYFHWFWQRNFRWPISGIYSWKWKKRENKAKVKLNIVIKMFCNYSFATFWSWRYMFKHLTLLWWTNIVWIPIFRGCHNAHPVSSLFF